MAVGFSETEPPASEESIGRLEQCIGQPLPPAYREFLCQYDGGLVELNNRAVDVIFGLGEVAD
jgi:SMI1 / KNR4 family (SUKH-1)